SFSRDWSSDVCSSDLLQVHIEAGADRLGNFIGGRFKVTVPDFLITGKQILEHLAYTGMAAVGQIVGLDGKLHIFVTAGQHFFHFFLVHITEVRLRGQLDQLLTVQTSHVTLLIYYSQLVKA